MLLCCDYMYIITNMHSTDKIQKEMIPAFHVSSDDSSLEGVALHEWRYGCTNNGNASISSRWTYPVLSRFV
jgi:hypothetical protein